MICFYTTLSFSWAEICHFLISNHIINIHFLFLLLSFHVHYVDGMLIAINVRPIENECTLPRKLKSKVKLGRERLWIRKIIFLYFYFLITKIMHIWSNELLFSCVKRRVDKTQNDSLLFKVKEKLDENSSKNFSLILHTNRTLLWLVDFTNLWSIWNLPSAFINESQISLEIKWYYFHSLKKKKQLHNINIYRWTTTFQHFLVDDIQAVFKKGDQWAMAITNKVKLYVKTSKNTANQQSEIRNSLFPARFLIVPSIFLVQIISLNNFSMRGNYIS